MAYMNGIHEWLNYNIFLSQNIFFFLAFSIFYAIGVPISLFIIDRLLPFKDRYKDCDKTEWVRIKDLQERVIIESNSIL